MDRSWNNTSITFKAIMIGKLLGDGSVTKQNGRKPRFQFTHTHTDFYWSHFCYKQLSQYIPLNPPKYKKVIDPRLVKGYSQAYYVQSRTYDVITYLRSQWYPNNLKILPTQLIENNFNKQSFAWWYMDDGHLKQKENTPEKIVFSTESFTIDENKWLINFLYKKYKLNFSLDKQNRMIIYDQFQIHYFLHLITPYLHHSMHRKVLHFSNLKHPLQARRTTIYLPSNLLIKSPTKEINLVLDSLYSVINTYKKGLFYHNYEEKLFSQNKYKTKGYQIVITDNNLSNLKLLRDLTGLTFSKLAELCFG